MPFLDLNEIEKQFLITLQKNLSLYQTNWCKLSLMEYDLKIDNYTVRTIAKNLESKGFIEYITPQIIKINKLGEEYLSESGPVKKEIKDIIIKPSELVRELPQLEVQKNIFIVHGHDKENLVRLRVLIKERWKFAPIILQDLPGKGRTLIEIIEEEGMMARYAFAIFTPDDFIEIGDDEYFQARPNVIFELGWFYGHHGRNRVCILCKEGTKIPSDLKGIKRIDFKNSVEEKILDIERELKGAYLLTS